MQNDLRSAPQAKRAIGWMLIAVCVALLLAAAESVQVTLQAAVPDNRTWGYRFGHLLLPWLIAVLFMPLVAMAARRFPLSRRSFAHWGVHALAAVAFSIAHLATLAAVQVTLHMIDLGVFPWTRILVSTYVFQDVLVYWAACGTLHAVALFDEARRREIATLQLERTLARAQFHALQAQLHPHFLFNTLNSVSTMARIGDTEAVVTMLARLSALLRRLLREAPDNEVRLDEEIGYVRQYIAIEQLRFGDGITLDVELDDDTGSALVPSFVLQPLVENALRHGFATRRENLTILIRGELDGGSLIVRVEDNGVGLTTPEAHGLGLGLKLTSERLETAYGSDAALTIASALPRGTVATIRLPFRPATDVPAAVAAAAAS